MHGWPGSVYEFLDIIPRLTDPAAFGGDPADSFTVVAPSLPGYGLSFRPGQKRFVVSDIAECLADLMVALGYKRFAAQGGDWGAFTASCMGVFHPDKLIGIHLNLLGLRPDVPMPANPTPEERQYFKEIAVWLKEETGYQSIQGTKPQTLAFALTDSPAGLAAWIAEKFHTWSDNDGTIEIGDRARPAAGEHLALLVHRMHRRVLLALLRATAWTVAYPGWADGGRADGLRRLSPRDPPPTP